MNPDKLLPLLMGRCWHEEKTVEVYGNPVSQCSCGRRGGATCLNPSYSDPRHRDEFFTWLCRERGEMWFQFKHYAYSAWIDDADSDELISWLFFSDPSRPRDLMAEWLQLDETVERFGWVKCPNCDVFNTGFCTTCGGSGRVLSAWAQYAKEAK